MDVETLNLNTKFISKTQLILVIDDNADSLYLGRAILERDGFLVLTAGSGAEALQILEENNFPDLILLDMKMKEMTGADFLKKLEEKSPETITKVPVVFYSALDRMPKSKACGFIRKAGTIDQFLDAVHGFLKSNSMLH